MSELAIILETDFSSESDADLLTWISLREEDVGEANRACCEFHNRYSKLLISMCMKRYCIQIGKEGVRDLVNDTFLRVFDKAAVKFKTTEIDPKKLRRQVGAWLGKIAFNLFLMRLKEQEGLPTSQLETDFDPHDEDGFKPEDIDFVPLVKIPMTPERVEQSKHLKPILDGLDDRERIILLTRFKNDNCLGGKQQFDSDDLEQLATEFRTTKDNIRQIFHRTFQKVKKQLLQLQHKANS